MNKEDFLKTDGKVDYIAYSSYLEQKENNLIKYLEDMIKETRIGGCDCLTDIMFETEKRVYQDILERLKSGKYE